MGLNEAQEKAANHYKSPYLVIAGPGSGKTTVLIKRIRNLIYHHQVRPENILVLTYTKAAAMSMQQRFLAGESAAPGVAPKGTVTEKNSAEGKVTFGTFHAVCYQILKSHYHLPKDCLVSEKEKFIFLNPILKNKNIMPDNAEDVFRCISLFKNGFSKENLPYPQDMDEAAFVGIFEEYAETLKKYNKIDFDDMVSRCQALFLQKPLVLKGWQERFQFLLVDEFQDCNFLQYEVLKQLAGENRNLFAVGDDDQSIYGFRGARPGIMQQFRKDYPETQQIYLEANYRSCREIIAASGKVIAKNRNRFPKQIYAATKQEERSERKPVSVRGFMDRTTQYSYLVKKIKKFESICSYVEMAVIFRTNREIEDLIPFLEKENIPYTVKGTIKSKYDHFTVKDLIAYLQLAVGNLERCFLLQVMNKPVRGIERVWISDSNFTWEKLKKQALICREFAGAEAVEILKRQCMQAGKLSPYLAINWVRKIMGYDKWISGKAGSDRKVFSEWMTFLDEIQNEAKNFDTITDWLFFVEQQIKAKEKEGDGKTQAGVQLMTMHTSKGLEFFYVCIPNVNEGNIPHGKLPDEQIREEERRLFYVAMTRAKTALEILYLTGTKEHPRLPSAFLNELAEYKEDYSLTSSSNS